MEIGLYFIYFFTNLNRNKKQKNQLSLKSDFADEGLTYNLEKYNFSEYK